MKFIDRDQVIFWLTKFKNGDIEDENFRRHIIDLMVNSITVWDDPEGFKITTAYNLTSNNTKTFRISDKTESTVKFGFEELNSTNGRISEPYLVLGTIFIQTKRHALP